ncbi:transposable element Tcb1 transposase [Trichonephila clavipes]|nr:transposable element Tcb1 transposase [Trichonephila clavipes]
MRNARVQPTASLVAIQAQVAPSLGASVSSRTMQKCLAGGHLGSRPPLHVLHLAHTHGRLHLKWCHACGNWTATEWKQVVFSNESRFNFSSDDNRVRVWRPRSKRLKVAFALQPHTTRTAGGMVWGVIAYNNTVTTSIDPWHQDSHRYVHDIMQPHVLSLMQWLAGAVFQQDNAWASHSKGVTRLSPHCYYHSLANPIPRFVSSRAYLGSFGIASWASHEFERTRGRVTANMERNVLRHHTELVCLTYRSYRIVLS